MCVCVSVLRIPVNTGFHVTLLCFAASRHPIWSDTPNLSLAFKRLICVLTDGMFGRCHAVPVTEVYTYDVSPSVVQRFRILLEKLSSRGTHTQTVTDAISITQVQLQCAVKKADIY